MAQRRNSLCITLPLLALNGRIITHRHGMKRLFWNGYVVAVVATVGLLMVLELMQPIFKGTSPVLLFLVGVVLAVWYDGLWAGLLATLLSALASVYFLAEPYRSWQVVRESEQVRILLFLGVGCAVSAVIAYQRQAAESSLREALLKTKQLQDEAATRQQAEDALRMREQELRQARELLEAVTGGTKVLIAAVDRDFRYTFFNHEHHLELKRLTGKETRVGMSLVEVLEDMPDERDRALDVWRRALSGELVAQTLEFGDPLRHRRWYSTQHAPIRNAVGEVVGAGEVTSDITELVEAQHALRRSEARWNAAIESFAEGAIIATADEQVIYWNPAAREMHGYTSPGEGIGPLERTPVTFQLWTPDGSRMLKLDEWPMRRIKRGEPVRNLELRVRRPDQGWERIFAYSGTMVETGVGERLIFLTCHDLTELRRAEQALREADQRKTEFLAILAHELRNPLAPIRNATHILKRKSPDDPGLRAAQDLIERQVKHMVRLIDDLLDVSRITRGRLELRRERVELAAVLDSAIESVRPYLDQATKVLSVSLPTQPVFLDGDFVRLTQVFLNVIHNACKYTDREQGRITLTAELDGPVVIVRVRDNGLGIAAECLPFVFDLFSQVDAAAQKSPGGLGIGLALSRGIVQLHGGSIEARSAGPGEGSEFIVRLPVLTEPVASSGEAELWDDVSPQGGDLRILVVDDNRDSAASLCALLATYDYEVETAYDGWAAIAMLTRFRPHLILLDIGMPGLDGYGTCRIIREQAGEPQPKIIAVTGWGQEEDRRKSREAGFDAHLVKPLDPTSLLHLIEGWAADAA